MIDDYEQRVKMLPEVFDGKMNPEVIELLRYKIASVGMPKSYIAKVLGVSSATMRKWLNNETTRCSSVARLKLMRFLKGDYDHYMKGEKRADETRYSIRELPDNLLLCMERISRIYDYCSKSEEMRTEFVERMDKAAFNALMALIPGGEEDGNSEKQ